jgi:deazaflavin-dependent oxidoreductase (nitroreductase family)
MYDPPIRNTMTQPDFNEINRRVTAEFHANGGKLGGAFEGTDILILTTTGAKSGQTRWNPLAYSRDGDRYIVVASKAGSPNNPDWYHNLLRYPSVSIEVGTENVLVDATVAEGAERDRLFAQHAERLPRFREYERNTSRKIPVVILTPKS